MIPILTFQCDDVGKGSDQVLANLFHLTSTGELNDHGRGLNKPWILHQQNEEAWAKWSLRSHPNLVTSDSVAGEIIIETTKRRWPFIEKDLLLSKRISWRCIKNMGFGI